MSDLAPTPQELAAFHNRNGRSDPPEAFPSRSIGDLRALPPVAWLIYLMLVARALVVLYGASGVGKSFLALDWALTVASGEPWWQGRQTDGGWVLYVSAEGSGGIVKRVDAWCEARGVAMPERIRFVCEAPNLLDAHDRQRILATVAAMPDTPKLIVIDTMARTLVGGDENRAQDVGVFVAAVDELRAAADGATAIVVHHTGKRGDDERGSSALRAASDQMLALTADSNGLRLEFNKVKDFEAPESLKLHLAKAAESAVIRLGSDLAELGALERRLLQLLSDTFGSDRVSTTRLEGVSEMSQRTYFRALQTLRQQGFVESLREGRATFNWITARGVERLLPSLPDDCQVSATKPTDTARPIGRSSGSDRDDTDRSEHDDSDDSEASS